MLHPDLSEVMYVMEGISHIWPMLSYMDACLLILSSLSSKWLRLNFTALHIPWSEPCLIV